jgi:uncharacterized protein
MRGKTGWTLRLGLLALAGVGMLYAVGRIAMRPEASIVARMMPHEQRFTLTTDDGVRIAASYFPVSRINAPAVLLLHGIKSSRSQFAHEAGWLNRAGFAVLAIDFRGHGESEPRLRSFGLFEARDAHTAFKWLKTKQADAPVAVMGFSLGGAAAVLGENGPVPADALILHAVYPDIRAAIRNRIAARVGAALGSIGEPLLSYQSYYWFGVGPDQINPANALAAYHGPTMVIGGAKDEYTPPGEVRAMARKARQLDTLWIIPNEIHGVVSTINAPEYQARVLAFLEKHLVRSPTRRTFAAAPMRACRPRGLI